MTENEMADEIMGILGMDRSSPHITEVEAGTQLNEVEVEDEDGNRFRLLVELIPPADEYTKAARS